MILLLLLFGLVFTACWLGGGVTWIRLMRTKSQMRKLKAAQNLKFKDDFGNLGIERSNDDLRKGGIEFANLVLRFAPIESSRQFVNRSLDMKAINETRNSEVMELLERRARLMSAGVRFWIVGFSSGWVLFLIVKIAEWFE